MQFEDKIAIKKYKSISLLDIVKRLKMMVIIEFNKKIMNLFNTIMLKHIIENIQ